LGWIEELFLQHADLFLKVITRREERTDAEVDALSSLFAELDVRSDARVLDLCCGYGRHTVRLATKGYHVTGVDLSPHFIHHGQELADTMQVQDHVDFHVGDARSILRVLDGRQGTFDAIINMWTSLGYYDTATDHAILQQLHQLATPQGILVLEMANRDFIVKHFQPLGIVDLDDLEVHEHRAFNLKASRMDNTWKFYRKTGESLTHLASIPIKNRVYSLHELIALFQTTGWSYLSSSSTFERDEPVTPNRSRLLIVGRNTASS
jgi:SAM-dependent methyltransferase